jgi:hypothetical protein
MTELMRTKTEALLAIEQLSFVEALTRNAIGTDLVHSALILTMLSNLTQINYTFLFWRPFLLDDD